MIRIGTILCAVSLPVAALAYDTAQPDPETSGSTTVIIEPGASDSGDDAQETVVSDCSGNTITIVNTGTRIAAGGGNAAGVTINGNSITIDRKTIKCGTDQRD